MSPVRLDLDEDVMRRSGSIVAPQQRYGVGEELRRLMPWIGKVSAKAMHNRLEFPSTWG